MTSPKRQGSAVRQQPSDNRPTYVGRYLGIDTHLNQRNGSTEDVTCLAAERPAGRKLAQDLAAVCNQLAGEGYVPKFVLPVVSGRVAELEAVDDSPDEPDANPDSLSVFFRDQSPKQAELVNDASGGGIGYSVTDGVVVIGEFQG